MPLIISIIKPSALTSAPPDEPGFDAASVYTKSSILLKPILFIPKADTTPQVMPMPIQNELLSKLVLLPISGSCDEKRTLSVVTLSTLNHSYAI